MIPNDAIVAYQGSWSHNVFSSAGQIVSDVSAKLLAAGLLVRTSKTSVPLLGYVGAGYFDVTLQLQVENGLGFGSVDDIGLIVRSAVNDVTGEYPASQTFPDNGQPTSTPGTGCVAGASTDLSGAWSLSCWFGNLTSKGFTTIGILAVVAVAAMGLLVFYGPKRN